MENVIINFTSDPAGLQPGIDGLVQLEVVDREVADQAKKTMEAVQKRDKAIADGAGKGITQVEKLSASFKDLDKNIVGGAYDKALKQLQKELGNTGDEFKQLALVMEFAKKKQAELKPNSKEWKELQTQIEQAEEILKAYGQETGQTEEKTKSFKARLRELKQELAQMEEAGQEGSEQFRVLAIEAAQLEDQIGDTQAMIRNMASDTFAFDALIGGVTAITAAYSVGQGAAALFGEENEEVQQALLKVNAAMAILQGLQQIQNTLQRQSAVSLAVENAQRRIATLQTTLQAQAESRNVIAKYSAIIAQKALNAVMATSPAGALLLAIGAIAGALLVFSSNSKTAADSQKELNDQLKQQLDYLELLNTQLNRPADDRINQLNNELTLLKSKGASQDAILQKELEIARAEDQRAQASKGFYADEIANLGLNEAKVESLQRKLIDLNNELRTDGDAGWFSRKLFGTRKAEDINKDIEAVQGQIENLNRQVDIGKSVGQTAGDAAAAATAKINEIQQKAYQDSLKSATAFAEARVLQAQEGTREELNARIAAIRTAQREELANVNLTEGERAKIIANGNKQIEDLQFDFQKKALENAKKGIDAQVLQAKEGSKQELDLKLSQLEAAKKIELKDKELTENKKREIEARYLKERTEMIRAFNQKVAEDAVNGRIAEINSTLSKLQVDNASATNEQLLQAKQRLIDEQAALEVISIQESEKNEELRRLKIQAVYDKALADKKQLERDKILAETEASVERSRQYTDASNSMIAAELAATLPLSKKRKELEDQQHLNKMQQFQKEMNATIALYEQKAITAEQYEQRVTDIQRQKSEERIAQTQLEEERMMAIRDFAYQTFGNLLTTVISIQQKGYDAEESKIRELYDLKQISEEEYNNRLRDLRRKQAQDEKAMALFNVLLQQGPTLLKGFQQGGFAGVAAALTLFMSVLQAVTSVEPPAFKDGEILIQGPGTETSDSIPARLSRNESVIRASMSKKHEDVLRAINEDRYADYLRTFELPRLYQNMSMPPQTPEYVQTVTNVHQQEGIDYGRMAAAFAQELANNPHFTLSIDENGFMMAVKQGNDLIEYKNKKLNL